MVKLEGGYGKIPQGIGEEINNEKLYTY